MDKVKNIDCPNCGHAFDVEQVLASKIDRQYQERLVKERAEMNAFLKAEQNKLAAEQQAFAEKKRKENEIFKSKLEQAVQQKENQLKSKLQDDFKAQLQLQEKELKDQTEELNRLKAKEIENLQLKRKIDSLSKDLELQFQQKLNQQLKATEESVIRHERERAALKLKEKEKQLEDQKKLIEEMRRKSEQGSMQLQGEILELAIEDLLAKSFPTDIVEEVPKGISGADCILTVRNDRIDECGKIIIESKRTKTFSNEWINKLKVDQRTSGADLAVLVTQAFPKEIESFGEIKGVWICSFQEMTNLMTVLRQILIRANAERSAQENKGEKIEILYNFLTSVEFKNQITSIVEGFSTMKEELDKEKRAMKNIWKRREKQIEIVMDSTIDMYGSIRGIAGSAIQPIEQLEMPDSLLESPE